MKRVFDFLVSTIILIVLSPVLLLIAFLVKLTSPGPVLYLAKRVGKGGGIFHLYKFRSMVMDADVAGPKVTIAEDPRVTPVGIVLRKFKLDELPQFLNVLVGEMSLVGPRPEDPHYVAHYSLDQKRVLDVLPGVTSAASVKYHHEAQLLRENDWERTYLEVVLPKKLRMELEYIDNHSFWSDLAILWQTFLAIFRK
jgi:lipopolysaccharide/colanic/teichoic acid biosynthesis glycosyltransferase